MKIRGISVVQEIARLLCKAFQAVVATCGGRRDTEGAVRSFSQRKWARTTLTGSEGSPVVANLLRENEQLRRQLSSRAYSLDILNQLESCQYQLNERNLKIEELINSAVAADHFKVELEKRVVRMQQQLCKELEEGGSYADGRATPFLLEFTLKALQTSVSSFSKFFLRYTKSQSMDADRALIKHFEDPFLTRPMHVTYLLKAWTFKAIFMDFENESFSCGGTSIFLDHAERRVKYFEYFQVLDTSAAVFNPCADDCWEQFLCHKFRGFLSLWQSYDQVNGGILSSDALEDDLGADEAKVRLMDSFRSVAKGVWALHKLSLSFPTRVEIFRVGRHNDFTAEYMESVVSKEDDDRFASKVGFMICPGFRLNRSVIKCQIYLAKDPNVAN